VTGPERLAVWAAAATGVQVGLAIVATRFAVDQLSPAALAMLRYVIGFLCLLPAALAAERRWFEPRDALPIAALGIGQFGVLIWLLNFGLQHIQAGRAALIFASFPLMTLLLGAALGREPLSANKLAGVLATIAGVGLAIGAKLFQPTSADEWLGAGAVLASALVGAVCSIYYRPYLQKYPVVPVSAFAMLASVLFLAVWAALDGTFAAPLRVDAAGWAAIVFIGVSSGVGYFLWLFALGNASPTRVTIFLGLSPVTAALVGAALLGEPLTWPLLAGAAMVLAGLWLAHR
jgi:drug/metabolite transporter (DMT)-like permease